MTFDNKVVVLTGATGYFGAQIARAFHGLGARVALLSTQLTRAQGLADRLDNPACKPFEVDLRCKQSTQDVFQAIQTEFGAIDVLINNAYYCSSSSFYDIDDADWDLSFDGTVKSSHRCVINALPLLKQSSSGRIINISSMYGLVSPDPKIYSERDQVNPLAYGVGKAALIQYTKYAAMMLAEFNITVNAVSYGPFPNPEKNHDAEFLRQLAAKTMLNRVGQLDDLTSAILCAASPENSFMTGQNIIVDGGWTAW